MIRRSLTYLEHLLYIRHRKGHGIHSPYLFELVHDVIFKGNGKKVPKEITVLHRVMKKDCSLLPEDDDLGAGSTMKKGNKPSVGDFVKRSSVKKNYGALLCRISDWFGADSMLELGTGLGISALYLAAGNEESSLYTVEGSKIRALLAAQVIKRSGLKNVQIIRGDLGEELEALLKGGKLKGRFLAYLDGNHRYDPTLAYARKLVKSAGEEAVIVMDDIYWSREMERAWKEIISWPEVRVSIDLYRMGILLLRPDLDKRDLRIKF